MLNYYYNIIILLYHYFIILFYKNIFFIYLDHDFDSEAVGDIKMCLSFVVTYINQCFSRTFLKVLNKRNLINIYI